MEHCKSTVMEKAAMPKYVEILPEVPKTAVGKVFKPDLRKMAIERIYNEALEAAGSPARVVSVSDDKKRGLVAQIQRNDATEEDMTRILGAFTRPWEWAA